MPKRTKKAAVDLDEEIKVGEGDDTISDWYLGFDVIDEINTCLWDGPELEWEEIADELTAYPEFANRLEGLEGEQDLLTLFEEFPAASIAHSFYDQGSPGCSGFYIEAFVSRKHLEYVQKAFSALLGAIAGQLEKSQKLPENE